MTNFIPVNQPLLEGNESKYLKECIDTGWISSEGPFVKKFEDSLAAYCERQFAVAVSSGSAALDIAFKAIDLSESDEVILPSFTIISCINAIIRSGAKPVLVDCDKRTFNVTADEIEKKITPKTRAILMVHLYGLPCDISGILALAKKHNLLVIEDAAEAHGLLYKGKRCGSFGDISIFSFYANKLITTGEGGMLLTNSPLLSEKFRSLRDNCFIPERRFKHEEMGFNYRLTNLQAAVGLAQFERIADFINKKRKMGKIYQDYFSTLSEVYLPLDKTETSDNLYWVFPLLLKETFPINANEMMKKLGQAGIGCRPFFYPLHQQPVFRKAGLFSGEEYPVSDYIAEKGFYIPSGLNLTEEDVKDVAERVIKVFHEHS